MSRRVRFHAKPNLGSVKSKTEKADKNADVLASQDFSEKEDDEKSNKKTSEQCKEVEEKNGTEIQEEILIDGQEIITLDNIEDAQTSENSEIQPSTSTTEEISNQPMTRRPRFVAKPNVGGAFRPVFRPPQNRYSFPLNEYTPEPTQISSTHDDLRQETAASSLLQLAMGWPNEPPPSYMMPLPLPPTPKRVENEDILSRIRTPSPKKYANLTNLRIPTPSTAIVYAGSPMKRQRNISLSSAIKKPRKPSSEELDTKTFTLADLITWKPSVENELKKKIKEKRKQIEMVPEKSELVPKENAPKEKENKTDMGPKVKLDEAGNIVIDEESLIMSQIPETSLQMVDDDLISKKLNSWSFRKWKRTSTWSKLETDLFYEVLGACGPDFGLMQDYIPTRTRAEIKKKFNKEEKTDRRRIDERLKNPARLDDLELKRITEYYYNLIEKEEKEKEEIKKEKEAKKVENRMRRSNVKSDIISGVSSLVQAHQTQAS